MNFDVIHDNVLSIPVKLQDTEIVNVTEEMTKQLQEAEMILETEKQKLLKVLGYS